MVHKYLQTTPAHSSTCPLQVDLQRPDWQDPAGNARTANLRHSDHQPPQGCVLSPLLFSFYTNDSKTPQTPLRSSWSLQMTPLSFISSTTSTSQHINNVDQLVLWCGNNNVELIVGFRSPQRSCTLIISQDLKWEKNISSILKKVQQWIFLLEFSTAVIQLVERTFKPSLLGSEPPPRRWNPDCTVGTAERITVFTICIILQLSFSSFLTFLETITTDEDYMIFHTLFLSFQY